MKTKTTLLLWLSCLLTVPSSAQIGDLRCEGLSRPMGIGTTVPRFSWKLELTHNRQKQTAYEIEVGSDSVALEKGKADLWKTGKVASSEQLFIEYQGKALSERQLCYWRVRTWDEMGRRSPWSATERFAVGILSDMHGQYIGLGQQYGNVTTPMLRTKFDYAPSKNRSLVVANINSLGFHELYINGSRVGDAVLQPAMSDVGKHSLIVTYDITPYLRTGENEIMVWLGQGWYREAIFGAQYDGPLVKAEVCEVSSKGSRLITATDGSWQASASGYSYTGTWEPLQFGGERFDSNVEPTWHAATICPIDPMRTTPQAFVGNLVTDILSPKRIIEQADGSCLVDFGRVVTGWLEVTFGNLKKNDEVTMAYTDHIAENSPFESQGESDIYIANGRGNEQFRNRFHYHAFRYVQVSKADIRAIKALQISALQDDGASSFVCSDHRLNTVHDLIHYTLRCLTYSGYMVDCPHLERMGYGGDGNSSTMTLQTMYDVLPTYRNWLAAWQDAMDDDGSLPYVAPAYRTGGGPYWSGFIVKAPWRSFMNYGDKRLLEECYEPMKRWLKYVQEYSPSGLLESWPDTEKRMWFLGDWLAPTGVDVKGESIIHATNCFVSECLKDMVHIAELLGRTDDAAYFKSWRERLNAQIHDRFYHPETHSYANGTPLDMTYALLTDVAADATTRKAVEKQLLKSSYERYKGHIAAGLFGVPIFTEWAIENRQTELMATILRQTDYPGYLYMVGEGATTTWESWDGERSRVHNCYNGIGTWFYQALAGIRPDPKMPAYRHFFIDPQPVNGIDWVKASKPTPYGEIRVEWKNGELHFTVPVGTTAILFPNSRNEQTFEAGRWTVALPHR